MPLGGWPSISNDTGSGQDGTVFDLAFFTAIRASIEASLFGPVSGVAASVIVDEVVNARGSAANLDARLDVQINENGTFKNLLSQIGFFPGAAAVADGVIGGGISAQSSAVANSGAGETNLHTYTLQANHFNVNNKYIHLVAWGTLAANANAKTIRLYVGATQVLSFANTLSEQNWRLEMYLIRSSATAGKVMARIEAGGITDIAIGDNRLQHTAALVHTWTGSALIRVTGQGVASNDIVQDAMFILAGN